MSWVDNVLATPTIGVRIKTKLTSISAFRNSFDSFFDYLVNKYNEIEIKQAEVWGYSISPKDVSGFSYLIMPDTIVINYNYAVPPKLRPGQLPVIEQPDLKLYSELLKSTLEEIDIVLNIIRSLKDITYDRIGIIFDANLSKDSFPPGLNTWLNYLVKPWNTEILLLTVSKFLVKLDETDNFHDQCHHHIKLNELKPENEILFRLDWQRVYKNQIPFENVSPLANITACRDSALEYFDKFGQGDLQYE